MPEQKTWFITGANRGLGAAIATAALNAGHRVAATARNPETVTAALGDSPNLLALPLDITDDAQADAAVAAAVDRFGSIDVLVNNAGYGQLGVFEETSMSLIRKQFDTNTFGTMNITRAALPTMRAQGAGHIFTITSISGTVGVVGSGTYSASKFAVEGWMESLALELAPFGISATIVEPGYFKTDFLDTSSVAYGDIVVDAYAEESAQFRRSQDEMNHQQVGDPAKLAAALLTLAEIDTPPLRFTAGADAVHVVGEIVLPKRQSDLDTWRDLSSSLA
ncbi:SDR family NAD(P)-dependent oxidoreductase [Naasia lichenicola]|uniref:SDR family NAD(P)-dependent oxidoreductase n=1 Tax=Naasia lichenicola TaxID=2565933 RepID=A0A4S4FSF2_9MICO|nr:SDR family NAD(P)-dependent oxidoreductase [Naasia lichenicola]THG32832.1 SDR family NAD(P)-dependent oxidoreductase [Naasia lichenicola]